MYNKLKEVDKYNGAELINAVISICTDVDTDIINYNSSEDKVCKILTKMCIDIRNTLFNDIDVVYNDALDINKQLRYMCEKYGYENIIYYGIDTYCDYWCIIEDSVYECMYTNIHNDVLLYLHNDEYDNEIYNNEVDTIRWLIKYYWDMIDYDYNEGSE